MKRGQKIVNNTRSGEDPVTGYELLAYIREQLGLWYPAGGQRVRFLSQLANEKRVGVSVPDIVTTVKYVKAEGIRLQQPYGLFFHVKDALENSGKRTDYEIVSAVALALESETDEDWRRRLSLAKGKALERVYEQWKKERDAV